MRESDYYSILGFPTTESARGLWAAYRDFVRSLNASPAPPIWPSEFGSILQAFSVLLDSSKRRTYQEQLQRRAGLGIREPSVELVAESDEPVSILQDRNAAHPSFDEFYERLMRNFTGQRIPKSEHEENLTVHIQLAPEQMTGPTVQIGIPAYPVCPVCRGGQHAWPFRCRYCDGVGRVESVRSIEVRVPPNSGSEVRSSLEVVGIRNFYLTVRFSR
jgi:DnaJ-class molecular chaperone